jgi:molybdate-binding protein/DNA-binding XRE family transcriptional regulator
MKDAAPSKIKTLREARDLSQIALAAATNLTRQSIGAIEAGRSTPSVDVALRIAKALDCTVEELFSAAAAEEIVTAVPAETLTAGRVTVAHIAGRWVAYPLGGDGLRTCADALVLKPARAQVSLELVRPLAAVRDNVMLTGCATGLGLLSDRLNAQHGGPGRFLWLSRSSTEALSLLASQKTHLAGVHLVDPKTGDANVQDIKRLARGVAVALFTLARWEVGIVTPVGNPKKLRTVADFARRGMRIAVREPGSGVRRLLERELRESGSTMDVTQDPHVLSHGHLDVAQAIAVGAADGGIATRDVAIVYGLGFVPIAEERYDLALPQELVSDARIQRMLNTLTSGGLRRELSALGYDVRASGDKIADLSP